MIYTFNIKTFDGTTEVIPSSLNIAIPIKYNTLTIDNNFTLTTGTEVIEIIDVFGYTYPCTIAYTAATGQLLLTVNLMPAAIVDFNISIADTSDTTNSITLDLKLFNVLVTGDIWLVSTDTEIKASIIAIQEPLSNNVYYYNLTNSVYDTSIVLDAGNNAFSFSSTGVIAKTDDDRFTVNLNRTYINDSGTVINLFASDTFDFIYNTFIPKVSMSIDNNGFILNGFPTEHTIFKPRALSDYSAIKHSPQVSVISYIELSNFTIESISGNILANQTIFKDADSTNLDFIFDDYSNLYKGDYYMKVKNSIITEPLDTPIYTTDFVVGNYYLPVTVGICTAISYGGDSISITADTAFYIDPAVFGTVGTLLTFTDTNIAYLSTTVLYNAVNVYLDNTYHVRTGSVSINGVSHTDIVYLSQTDTIIYSSDVLLLPFKTTIFYEDFVGIKTFNPIEITRPSCNEYVIHNNSLSNIEININYLTYTIDKQGEYDIIDTTSIPSGGIYTFQPTNDGVYTITFNNSGFTDLVFVSTCNTEKCIMAYINDIICCANDNSCTCELQTVDCKYIDRSNFMATTLLYDTLKSMILDVVGINSIYNELLSDYTLKLHSISDILNKLNNFCNTCTDERTT